MQAEKKLPFNDKLEFRNIVADESEKLFFQG